MKNENEMEKSAFEIDLQVTTLSLSSTADQQENTMSGCGGIEC